MLLIPDITIFKLRLSEFFKNIVLYYNDVYLLQFDFRVDELLKILIVNIEIVRNKLMLTHGLIWFIMN
jgi:hypothetical protein